MPLTRFSKSAAMFDATPIENMFLAEYMPIAPEGFVRVYLYVRMVALHPEMGDSVAEVAKALRTDEASVVNALAYWEQQGLLEQISENPPLYEIKSLTGGDAQSGAMDRDYYLYRDFNADLQKLFGNHELLQPRQYKMANDWLNVMGMEQGAVLAVLKYELKGFGGKKPESVFKRADKRIIALADAGIRGAKDAEAALALEERVNGLSETVLERLGIYNRKPSEEERACVKRWLTEWNLTEENVLAACGATTKSRSPSVAYLDAILRRKSDSEDAYREGAKEVLRELGANAPITPEQTRRYGAWLAEGFEPETVRLAAAHCARRETRGMDALEELLRSWKEKGILTARKAEVYEAELRFLEDELRGVLEKAGAKTRVTDDDLRRYVDWKRKYSPEMIACAAEAARNTRIPTPYMDKVLANWQAKGVSTPEAARSGAKAPRKPAETTAPRFNYQQHTYTEADFGSDFYYDPAKDYGKGENA